MAVGTPFSLGQLPRTFQGVNASGAFVDVYTINVDGTITFNTAVTIDVVLSAVLSIAEGGTGATSAADALVALGLTASAAELNIMDGVTATFAELNYLDITTLGTGAASKAVVLDAGDDYTWPATGVLTYGGTGITATGAEINLLDNQVASVSWAVAAGAANVCVFTGTLKDAAGATIAASRPITLYISEASTGIGITADTYSTGASVTTGTQLVAHTANKAWLINTHTDGTFAISITDTAKPADQYLVAIDPQGQLSVSAASAALWGA